MKRLVTLLAIICIVLEAFAWGPKGHRIVAQVAYDYLDNSVRKHIDKVLGKQGMVYLSTIYPTSFTCHYQDLAGGMSDAEVLATLKDYPEEGGELWMALDSLEVVLKRDKYCHDALVFYVHLYADRFCPMHVAHLDDQGGNAVRFKWFGQNTNLHSVWDSKIIESKGFSYSEYAKYLHNVYGYDYKHIAKMTEEETLLHTYHLTDDIYTYHTTWSGNAYHYTYRWTEAVEYQMYLAGVQLAEMLNRIF